MGSIQAIANNPMKYVHYGLGLLCVIFGSVLIYEHGHDRNVTAENVRLRTELHADSLDYFAALKALYSTAARVDTDTVVVNHAIIKWAKTVHDTTYLMAAATPHDTIASLTSRLRVCRASGQEVATSVLPLMSDCATYRAEAQRTIGVQDTRYARLDSLYKIGRPAKRWNVSVGVGIGYGTSLVSLVPTRQVFVGVTGGRSLFSW